ncbi:MAG TPA: translocation/assembly module TamB domain-containing protein [Vicinamibacterales bacterium]
MTRARRIARVAAFLGAFLAGMLILAILATQTSWFKDWLRRYVTREAANYLNGELSIDRLSGNLFTGLELEGIRLTSRGDTVVAVKDLQLDYNLVDLITTGIVLDEVRINGPVLQLRRTAEGWNIARLVKEQAQEADREGPARPIRIGAIGITDGRIDVVDETTESSPIPRRIDRIDAKAAFEYEPVDFTLDLDHLSFRADAPALALNSLSGRISARGRDLHLDRLAVRTAESSMQLDAVVRDYPGTPGVEARFGADRLTLRELGPWVPALARSPLQPTVEAKASGPLGDLRAELTVASDAGNVRAEIRADADDSPLRAAGTLAVERARLERALETLPPTDVTARAAFDVAVDDRQQIDGRVQVSSPGAVVRGYRVDALEASAALSGGTAKVEATARAYGAVATAKGTVQPPLGGAPLAAEVTGTLRDLNVRRLPAALELPRLATDVDARYDLRVDGERIDGTIVFDRSSVAGATLVAGTMVRARLGDGTPRFSARGGVQNVNPRALGLELGQPALDDPRLDGRVSATFDMTGQGTSADTLTGSARVDVADARLAGAQISNTRLTAQIDRGRLDATLTGRVAGLDPAVVSGRPDLEGNVGATITAEATLPDFRNPSLQTATASAQLAMQPSKIGQADIESLAADVSLADGLLEVRKLEGHSTIARLEATGSVALDRTGQSDLRYHVEVPDLGQAGTVAGVPQVGGSAVLDGRLTGNLAELRTAGDLKLADAAYGTTAQAGAATAAFDVVLPEVDVEQVRAEADLRAEHVVAAGLDIRTLALDASYGDRQLQFDTTVDEATRRLEARGTAGFGDRIDVDLDRLLVQAEGTGPWTTTGPARATYDSDRVTARDLTLVSGDQRLSIDGSVVLGTGGETAGAPQVPADSPLTVRAERIDLAEVDRLAGGTFGLAGRLDATATLAGSVDAPDAKAEVTVAAGAVDEFRFDRFTANLGTDTSGTRVDARLDQTPGASLTVAGTLPSVPVLRDPAARGTAPLDLRVESTPVPLALVETFTTALEKVTGTLETNLHVTGPLDAPRAEGDVRVAGGSFTVVPMDTSFSGLDAHVALRGERIDIAAFRLLDEKGNPLTIEGGLSLAGRGLRDIDAAIRADGFGFLDGELGQINLDVDLRAAGKADRLSVTGSIGVSDGRVEVDRLLERFGQVPQPADPGADAAADAPAVPTPEPLLTGAAPELIGPALAARSREAEDAKQRAESVQPAGEEAPTTAGARDQTASPQTDADAESARSSLQNLAVDVKVDVPNNLVLRGDDVTLGQGGLGLGDLNITVGGNVHATRGSDGRLLVVGTINTVRGFYEFQRRRFELQRDGTISFRGPDPANPALDVTAIREISGIDAMVRVQGTAQEPELRLSSRPPLDEADVLSLIIFNRPINDLGTGERTTLAATVQSMVGGAVASPVAEALRSALDVDLLEISTVNESGGGPSVTVGNQVGERVFVRVRQQFGGSSATAVELEYQLNRLLRLQTSVVESAGNTRTVADPEGNAVDLVFVVRY